MEKPEVAAPAEGGAANTAEDEGISDLMDEGENAPSKEVSADAAVIKDEDDNIVNSYSDLQAAIAAATEKQTVVLQKDHKGSVEINKSVTLDLNQHKIDAAGTGAAAITVKKSETDDRTAAEAPVVVIKNGTVTGGEDSGVKVTDANVTLDTLTVTENKTEKNGGGVYIKDGTLSVKNSTISKNTAAGDTEAPIKGVGGGGGIYASGSDVTIDNSQVIDNKVTRDHYDGGGILSKVGTLIINNSTISGNTADDQGGGILADHTTLTITGSHIDNNKAKNGAGINLSDVAGEVDGECKGHPHTIDNSTINGNIASSIGGGMYVGKTSSVVISNSEMKGNDGGAQGGAIVAYTAGTITLDNTKVEENKANDGGGILVLGTAGSDTVINLNNGTQIINNTATTANGGGINVFALSNKHPVKVNINDSSVSGNTAFNMGGGIFAYDFSEVTANNSHIDNNSAAHAGGIMLYSGSGWGVVKGKLENCTVNNNKSTLGGGGGVYVLSSVLTIKGTEVAGNESATNGGGIYADTSSLTAEGNNIHGNTAKANGGGVWTTANSYGVTDNTFTNNTISENKAGSYGGGIYQDNGKLIATSNTISNNETTGKGSSGGGIFVRASNVELTDNTLRDNTTVGTGGGIYVTNPSGDAEYTLVFTNNAVENNHASMGGGVSIANQKHNAVMTGGTVSGNTATSYGGGIHLGSNSTLHVKDTAITNNSSEKVGGGIYHGAAKEKLTLENVTLTGNTANSGAAVYLFGSGAELELLGTTTITENTALYNGGGIYGTNKAIITLRQGALHNNHAGTAGDDLYLKEKSNCTLFLRPTGEDWKLNDCDHTIDGWYLDGKDARWDADTDKKFIFNLDTKLGTTSVQDNGDGTFTVITTDGTFTVQKFEDGSYEIHVVGDAPVALKAAHAKIEIPVDPEEPEEPAQPETPQQPAAPEEPVSPAQPAEPVSPAQPAEPVSPAQPAEPVSPAHPEEPAQTPAEVSPAAALPKTGVNWVTALAMALSGFALTAAGAFTSLFAKSRH